MQINTLGQGFRLQAQDTASLIAMLDALVGVVRGAPILPPGGCIYESSAPRVSIPLLKGSARAFIQICEELAEVLLARRYLRSLPGDADDVLRESVVRIHPGIASQTELSWQYQLVSSDSKLPLIPWRF